LSCTSVRSGGAGETAGIICNFIDAISVVEPRIGELSIGSWDRLAHIDIDAGWPGRLNGCSAYDWFFRAPDGESYEQAFARASSWLKELNGVTVAVSHGLIGRIIRGAYLRLAREQSLSLPVSHQVIWHLTDIEALTPPADAEPVSSEPRC
jgi:probable phosphoglycerate mutase